MRWCRLSDGKLDVFSTNWAVTENSRIAGLPAWLRPTALLARNAQQAVAWWCKPRRPSGIESRTIAEHLQLGIQYVHHSGVAGDIAEFGTMSGSTAAVLAQALKCPFDGVTLPSDHRFDPKNLYLFDSFQGLPQADSAIDQNCPHVINGVWGAGTCRQLSEEDLCWVCERFLPSERIVTMKGWFKEALTRLSPKVQFALIHIDSDLYQSAMDVLDHCFAHRRLPPGGIIYFDDWNSNHASPDFGERRAWADIVPKYQVQFSDAGTYAFSGQKFIVHGYSGG